MDERPRGRFAPSPTGDLHFGSLIAATASYLQSKSQAGEWLIRVEDLDPPREVAGSAKAIQQTLTQFGLVPDRKTEFQSTRVDAYQVVVDQLLDAGLAFRCSCSRSQLTAGEPYPGYCRNRSVGQNTAHSVRLRVTDKAIEFNDALQGAQSEILAETSGDFVIRRSDGLFAYQLAVVVDDAWQNITEVVRGADLLDSTARQIHLQKTLGYPTPQYAHVPVVIDREGRKLSKQQAADPVSQSSPLQALGQALTFLGHPPPKHDSLAARWQWALANWSLKKVPKVASSIPE